MKKHSNKQFDKLTKRALKDLPLERPSDGFTVNVMSRIETMPIPQASTYKPLIPKSVWIIMVAVVAAAIAIAYRFKLGSISWFDNMDVFNRSEEFGLGLELPSLEWSNPLLYATLIFGLLMLVQLKMLKPLFESRNLA